MPEQKATGDLLDNCPSRWRLAMRADVLRRALLTSLLVGTLLALINHGPTFAQGEFQVSAIWQIILTYVVPWGVSTWSAVDAIAGASQKT